MTSQYSDEMINAYVDDELDSRDREAFKQAMEADAVLFETVQSLCELKKSLKSSYADVLSMAPVAEPAPRNSHYGWQHAMAALLLLCVGMVFGWYGNSTQHEELVSDDIQGLQLQAVNMQQPNKIILHVSSSRGNKLEKTLQQVEYIVDQYSHNNLSYQLEVIANSGGIDLLRQDVSPYAERIADLMAKNENVSFIACSNAIEKLRLRGIEPRIIAQARTGGTAIEQIVKRLQQGWVYVKV